MKKILLLFIIFSVTLAVQKKEIVLEDIWSNGNFRTKRLTSFQSPTVGAHSLVHGTVNYNINVQNTLPVKIALIEANTKHDSETYPHKTDRIYGVRTQDYIFTRK